MLQNEPTWIAPSLRDFFSLNVSSAWRAPQYYHEKLAPIPWCIAIFGRVGVHKMRAISALCEESGIERERVKTIEVQLGKTVEATNEMDCMLMAAQSFPAREGLSSKAPQFIMIINHADILLYEADDKEVLRKTISWERFAQQGIMVVALFDRTGNDPEVLQRPTTPWEKEAFMKFYQQFKAVGFAPAPSGAFRTTYFKWVMNIFMDHQRAQGRKIEWALSPEEFSALADYSTYATPNNIIGWLQEVFYAIIQASGEESIGMPILTRFLTSKSGAPHICDFDTRLIEDRYSQYCGKGPVIRPKVLAPAVPPPTPSSGGGAEIVTNVTSFAPDVAGIQEAEQLLESQRKRQRTLDTTVATEVDF